MKMLGSNEDEKYIIDYLSHYTLAKGKFGTNPLGIRNFLKDQKFQVKCSNRVKKFDAYSKKCDAGIILYCADETCHYVAFERRGRK